MLIVADANLLLASAVMRNIILFVEAGFLQSYWSSRIADKAMLHIEN